MQIQEQAKMKEHTKMKEHLTPAAAELQPVFRAHAELCKALANEHRLAILYTLSQGEKCVSDLAAEIGVSVHNVSQHLRLLKERGLVRSRKEAQTVYYSITNFKFIQGCTLIRQALIEQHQAQGQSLLAGELLDAIQNMPLPSPPE
jgi:ArsR family transcriptional regulator